MTPISLVLLLGSSLLASALPAQMQFSVQGTPEVDDDPCRPDTPLTPGGVYYGSQKKDKTIPTRLRISNGGAGLSGLVERLANRFINDQLKHDNTPFKIEWIKGDTTETLHYLETGQADVGITYNKAAECQALSDHVADRREYGFRDHFYLVGPGKNNQTENPAKLQKYDQANPEGILQQLQKIVRTGNNPPNNGAMGTITRFLSRYDKSATNIKDSELFIRVGQVPWGLAYSKWYHQYTMYPRDALTAAALLKEYTITDRGTWLSTDSSVTDALEIYNRGADEKSTDPLLNPAFFLSRNYTGSKCETNKEMAGKFLDWIIDTPGQNAVKTFKAGSDKPCKLGSSKSSDPFGDCLYTVAPPIDKKSPIQDCKNTGL